MIALDGIATGVAYVSLKTSACREVKLTPFAVGPDPGSQRQAYRMLFDEVLTRERVVEIRAYLQQQRALGSQRFRQQMEAMLGRCAQVRPVHRPVTEKKGL